MTEYNTHPSPNFASNEYTGENPELSMFPMVGHSFSHPVPFEPMSMELDSLNIPFEWVG